ncbi:hypothetical protein V2J09_016410 [Rumex salicifolius]
MKSLLPMLGKQRSFDRQVIVSMEYLRKIAMGNGMPAAGSPERVMDFSSVFLVTPSKLDGDNSISAPPPLPGQQPGINDAGGGEGDEAAVPDSDAASVAWLLTYGMSMISTAFLGRLGTDSLGGGSLALGFANFTGYFLLSVVAMGMDAISLQATGEQ